MSKFNENLSVLLNIWHVFLTPEQHLQPEKVSPGKKQINMASLRI